MLESFFDAIGNKDLSEFSSVLFNVYEDKDSFSIEACFDEDALVIGRENPYVICGSDTPWKKVEKKVGKALEKYIKSNKKMYEHFDSIAYGFVDGDLNYIRKSEKKKETKEPVHFTAEDFKDLAPAKLEAWMTIYLTSEASERSLKEWFMVKFVTLSEEQLQHWREFLADNFDYEKYNKLK